ncbi:MAG TPA: alpha/beta hydrolase [Rudaea sp.]|nr:alpha/beta hydrolase [Rudaea sp.]
MSAREIEIALPHLTLAAREWGDPANPPLLALHGWLDNAASFDALAPFLCEHFHIVALDFAGHGRSAWRPAGTWYHYVDYLDDVLGAADALGWNRFSLLGHSLGGTVASVFAAVRPERVERLALIEALGPLSGEPAQALAQLARALDQRAEFAGKTLRVFPDVAAAVAARRQANGLSPTAAEALVERGIKLVAGGYSWSSDPRLTLASPLRYTEEQVLALVSGIRAPTLLVLAEPAPPYLPRAIVDARAAKVADIRVARIAGSHHLHLEDPQPVAAELRDFFAPLSRR